MEESVEWTFEGDLKFLLVTIQFEGHVRIVGVIGNRTRYQFGMYICT